MRKHEHCSSGLHLTRQASETQRLLAKQDSPLLWISANISGFYIAGVISAPITPSWDWYSPALAAWALGLNPILDQPPPVATLEPNVFMRAKKRRNYSFTGLCVGMYICKKHSFLEVWFVVDVFKVCPATLQITCRMHHNLRHCTIFFTCFKWLTLSLKEGSHMHPINYYQYCHFIYMTLAIFCSKRSAHKANLSQSLQG